MLQGNIVVSENSVTVSLVDLAGSEKFGTAGRQTGASINAGLLALGKTLTALKSKQSYVPFRDSTLTQMLRVALQECSVCSPYSARDARDACDACDARVTCVTC